MSLSLGEIYNATRNRYQLTLAAGENGLSRIMSWVYVSEDINIKKLGDTRLSDFLQAFNSKLFDTDGNNLLANMKLDQELKTIKRILIKNSEDPTKNSKIEYNC